MLWSSSCIPIRPFEIFDFLSLLFSQGEVVNVTGGFYRYRVENRSPICGIGLFVSAVLPDTGCIFHKQFQWQIPLYEFLSFLFTFNPSLISPGARETRYVLVHSSPLPTPSLNSLLNIRRNRNPMTRHIT